MIFQPPYRAFAVTVLLFIAIWLPRGLALDRLVTPDEPTWLTNSANFYDALAHRDFIHTYQIEHPGVTTMWIGTLGYLWRYPSYATEGPGQLEWWREQVDPFLESQGHPPLDLLVAGRSIMVLVITLVLFAAFLPAARLFGVWPALLGFLFIATDPFHVAHSRLLHLDGLASSFVLLSLLPFLNYLYGGRRWRDLALSAAGAGLAWLTKSPTLFLIPFMGLWVLFELGSKVRKHDLEKEDLRWAFKSMATWGGIGLAVFVVLWPAMWVAPLSTLWQVLRATAGYAVQGHEAPLFFNGSIYTGDPGLFFYPITYLWRASPFVLAGLGLAMLSLAAPQTGLVSPAWRRPMTALLLFAALFTLFMSLGAKKFDRYLLPAYLPLDLVAGIAWAAALRRLFSRQQALVTALGSAVVILIFVGQFYSLVSSYPYYLSYYNPLLGGTPRAPAVMMVGWGEGLDQAASYLNSLPGADDLQVATGVWNGAFSYFFTGRLTASGVPDFGVRNAREGKADYYVIYINQWQRGRLPPSLMSALAAMTPVKVVQIQGLEYVRVYDLRGFYH